MAEFNVATANLKSCGSVLSGISSELSDICQDLESTGNLSGLSIDGKRLLQTNIDSLLNSVRSHTEIMADMGDSLSKIAELYERGERNILSQAGIIITEKTISSGSLPRNDSGTSSQGDDNAHKEDTSPLDYWLDFFKSLFKVFGNVGDIRFAKLLAPLSGYLKNFIGFITGEKTGWAGISDFCDLADSSTSLWKGFYSFLKAGLDTDAAKAFMGMFGKAAAGASAFGSMFGILGSVCDLFGKEKTTWGDWPAGVLDVFKEGSGFVKDIYELVNFAALSNLPKKIHSAAGKYAILAETVFSSFSQMFKSIGKYSADGNWTLTDTASTGVDMSVESLENLVSGLTFGLISAETFGTSTEEISSLLKDTTSNIGTGIGEYILNHPEMKEKYQNGSIFDQIGLTVEAAFKSWFS